MSRYSGLRDEPLGVESADESGFAGVPAKLPKKRWSLADRRMMECGAKAVADDALLEPYRLPAAAGL